MPRLPLMKGHDGGAKRGDPHTRAAHGFRMIAATMRYVATEMEGTIYHVPIASEATRVGLYADELDGDTGAPTLRLV